MSPNKFTFEISLSVLNHLGRNLYRSFVTVLGEAISNSWDADAENVWIYIDHQKKSFLIKDDGTGMTVEDFKGKFLKIGYTKRDKEGELSPDRRRPFIGRKGIGKLALLSCADRITVASKTKRMRKHVGGIINNSDLDEAIQKDDKYPLEELKLDPFAKHTEKHDHGTIIYFENIRGGIKNRANYLKKIIALYFRFSLHDPSFNIFINDQEITLDSINILAEKTSFAWNINQLKDPYLDEQLSKNLKEEIMEISMGEAVKGFIASVQKPRDLKIEGIDERVGVDLFVNGRLRESDILKHIPTSRIAENYLYGQIHFDELDDKNKDRFTSNREGVVADDPKYKEFLESFKKTISRILKDWDELRIKHRQDGDPESTTISKEERKSRELFNVVSKPYELPKDSEKEKEVARWVNDLEQDAAFNFQSYAECFISENLLRKYMEEQKLDISQEALNSIKYYKGKELEKKECVKMYIGIRKNNNDLNYLDMYRLAEETCDPENQITFKKDAKEYSPIRNAVAHTALLTDEAKTKLTTVYNNIKAGIVKLLSS